MNILAILSAFLLAVTSTLAALPLPDGYWVSKVEPVPKKYEMVKDTKGNPHVPLINATFECFKAHYPFWKTTTIFAHIWPGVTEKTVRSIVVGPVTKWKWTSWERQKCLPVEGGELCSEDAPGFMVSESSATICTYLPGFAKGKLTRLLLTFGATL